VKPVPRRLAHTVAYEGAVGEYRRLGLPRIIPIFQQVQRPGNNATYTIVELAGVRITDVNLTGKMSSKRVIIQPAAITALGAIPAAGPQKSWYITSPAWLVR
jgi:hypothetical protein